MHFLLGGFALLLSTAHGFVRPSSRPYHGSTVASFRSTAVDLTDLQAPNKKLVDTYPLSLPQFATLSASGVTSRDWKVLLSKGELIELGVDEFLLKENEVIDDNRLRGLFLIMEGAANLEVKGQKVAKLSEGNFAGEASFVSGSDGPRSATVRATTPLKAMKWESQTLKTLLSDMDNSNLRAALYVAWMQELGSKLHKAMIKIDIAPASNGVPLVEGQDYGYKGMDTQDQFRAATPPWVGQLAAWNFQREYGALRNSFRFEEFSNSDFWLWKSFKSIDKFLEFFVFPRLEKDRGAWAPIKTEESEALREKLKLLTLNNTQLFEREHLRMKNTKDMVEAEALKGVSLARDIVQKSTPWFVMLPYRALCELLDRVFENRPIQRFWLLETVARMPYFSYLSMLHLYESLGWWQVGSAVRRIHFFEEWNEFQHLQIMESLGGDTRWSDRFLARHAAILYYWALNVLFLFSPFLAYNFSELIEAHAVDTYLQFAEENKELLMSLPPPVQAVEYYCKGDLYMFKEFQTSASALDRRPTITNLYDVFSNICRDEMEHVKTMFACERGTEMLAQPSQTATEKMLAELEEFDKDDAFGGMSARVVAGLRFTPGDQREQDTAFD